MVSASPIGIVAEHARSIDLARKIADAGVRVLLHLPRRVALPDRIQRVERVATPTDIAFECGVVLTSIRDSEAFKDLLIGKPERAGLGADMQPGSILVDLAVRRPRELQALLGLLGTRGIALADAAVVRTEAVALDGAPDTVFVGGFPDAVAQTTGVLGLIGHVMITGRLGSAHTTAAVEAYAMVAKRAAAIDVDALGRAMGVSVATAAFADCQSNDVDDELELHHRFEIARRIAEDQGLDTRTFAQFGGVGLRSAPQTPAVQRGYSAP